MTEARLFQVQEIARIFQIPPNFLGDLSRATYSNVEQNDLYLIKHLVSQWCGLLEGEMNLKIFGRMNGNRYVRHNLEGLQRGDFLSRLKGLTSAVQGAILTPDEAREIEGRPRRGGAADQLYMQGATVPLDNVDPLGGNTPSEPDPEPPYDDQGKGNPGACPAGHDTRVRNRHDHHGLRRDLQRSDRHRR